VTDTVQLLTEEGSEVGRDFLAQVKSSRVLPIFERMFSWGRNRSLNDVDLDAAYAVEESHRYCAHHGRSESRRHP
jgi:hypothetical protein